MSNDNPTTPAHTPGPWQYERRINVANDTDTITFHSSKKEIAKLVKQFISDEDLANARLIATAPELLEVCILMVDALENSIIGDGHSPIKYAMAKMNDTIRKAKGE